MFKRVEKRRRKRQEEDDLGLDEEKKEILGIHDTDSDESDSDSEDHQSTDGGEEDDLDGFDGELSDQEESEPQSDDHVDEKPPITVQEALRDPLYIVSLQPVIKACIVCPGKLLKSTKMVDLHKKSNACMVSLLYVLRLDLPRL